MFYVKVGYYGDSCDVCGKSQVDLLQPIIYIEQTTREPHSAIIGHKICLVERINAAIQKFDDAFKVIDK